MSVLDELLSGQRKLREVETHVNSPAEAAAARRDFLKSKNGTDLSHTGQCSFDLETATTYNVENLIGATQIPVGITETLLVNGEFAKGEFNIPLATTEKSLIAGISRGCKAITLAGGANTWVQADKMTRAPLFRVDSLAIARQFLAWLEENFPLLAKTAAAESRFTRLISHRAWLAGRNVFVQLHFETGDAMGMNMVTQACNRMGHLIERTLPGVKYLSVSGNMCIDKKPAAMNLINGRGKTVHAEAVLPTEVVKDVLKTTPTALVEINQRKNLVGSALAGGFGFNAHFANMVAALYIATGQDPAHVVEGALGITLIEQLDETSLHISVTLPAIEVATVGGGTRLQTQQECLSLLGCAGSGNPAGSHAKKLAEVVAATVLAGEISLLAAESAHHLADAHKITRA